MPIQSSIKKEQKIIITRLASDDSTVSYVGYTLILNEAISGTNNRHIIYSIKAWLIYYFAGLLVDKAGKKNKQTKQRVKILNHV